MWRVINSLRKRFGTIGVPLSTKLTLMYTGIMLMILVFTTALATGSVYYLLMHELQTDVRESARRVESYIERTGDVDAQALHARNVIPHVRVVVYDHYGRPLLDNYNRYTVTEMLSQQQMDDISRAVDAEKTDISRDLSYRLWQRRIAPNGSVYYLAYWREAGREKAFVDLLVRQIVITFLAGIGLTVFAGLYLTDKVLAPMRAMLDPLRRIEANEMGHRVPVPSVHDEQRELALAINRALDRIEAGIRQQRRFVSDASHELRTPITVIGGYADMLVRWGGKDPETRQEGLTAIQAEAAYMESLIERLLFLARASSGEIRMQRTQVDLPELLESVGQGAKMMDHGAHVWTFDTSAPATVDGDPALIKQLVRIFIENAIKYTPQGRGIALSSRVRDDVVDIVIRDEGIGMEAAELPHIFTRFYRVDSSRTKDTGGTGLGLAIAKDIADMHGATIHTASVPGEGTTFTLSFPAPKQPM